MMILSGCNSVIIKKRRYFKGYYVHFPLGRNSSPQKHKRDIIPHRDSLVVKNDTTTVDSLTTLAVNDSITSGDSVCVFFVNPQQPASSATSTGFPLFSFAGINDSIVRSSGSDTIRFVGNPPSSGQPGDAPVASYVPGIFPDDTLAAGMPFIPADSIAPAPADDTCLLFVSSVPQLHKKREFETEFHVYSGLNGFQANRRYAVNPNSFNTGFEMRMKTKLNPKSELTGAFGLGINSISLSQRRDKPEPFTTGIHSRERLTRAGVRAALGVRYHLPDRVKENGEKIKMEIDLEARGETDFYTANVFTDHFTDAANVAGRNYRVKTRITGLPYLHRLNYGVTARFTRNGCSAFAGYRISQLIADPDYAADLPKLTVGVGFMLR